jgi:hypothetical protein
VKFFLLGGRGHPTASATFFFSKDATFKQGAKCSLCEKYIETFPAPLRVSWQPGSDRVADFSWEQGGYLAVVTGDMRKRLLELKWPCRFRRVIVDEPVTARGFANVPYPYTGPPLYWLVPRTFVEVDASKSGLVQEAFCDRKSCGLQTWEFRNRGPFVLRRSAQLPIFFGLDIYKAMGPGPLYVSAQGRSLLQSLKPRNLSFTETRKTHKAGPSR